MFVSRTRRALASFALAIPALLVAAPALASGSLTVKANETVVLDGTVRYKEVVVEPGGVIAVRSMGSGGSGTLTIIAESVSIAQGAKIDATGAGHEGTTGDGSAPSCCAAAGGGEGPTPGTPGGGGGSGGKGAAGCVGGSPTGGQGGELYVVISAGRPGAAGGAATPAGATDVPILGGRGGGSISIVAAKVEVQGDLVANGVAGTVASGVGTGGGGGGFIRIDSYELTGMGSLSARGGDGGVASDGIGGGGGGGVILISTTLSEVMDATLLELDVSGGATGTCTPGDLGVEEVDVDATKPCIDADTDEDPAEMCGGGDCDDSDETVESGAVEVCDGQDNDCDGTSDGEDELSPDACGAGFVCQDGACASEGSGSSGSGGDAAAPDYVQYRGACDMRSPRATHHLNGAAFFGAALVGFLAALGVRRKRR